VYVIVDADARPFSDWLSNLVAPLADGNAKLGAVTSARIYLPGKGLASLVQVLWILISAMFLVGKHRYIWGGGLAIPKAVFEKAHLGRSLEGQEGCSITTDDMNILNALRSRGYETLFVPDCLVLRHPPAKKETLAHVITFTNLRYCRPGGQPKRYGFSCPTSASDCRCFYARWSSHGGIPGVCWPYYP